MISKKTITDETLDFMKRVSIDELEKMDYANEFRTSVNAELEKNKENIDNNITDFQKIIKEKMKEAGKFIIEIENKLGKVSSRSTETIK